MAAVRDQLQQQCLRRLCLWAIYCRQHKTKSTSASNETHLFSTIKSAGPHHAATNLSKEIKSFNAAIKLWYSTALLTSLYLPTQQNASHQNTPSKTAPGAGSVWAGIPGLAEPTQNMAGWRRQHGQVHDWKKVQPLAISGNQSQHTSGLGPAWSLYTQTRCQQQRWSPSGLVGQAQKTTQNLPGTSGQVCRLAHVRYNSLPCYIVKLDIREN